MFNVFKYWGFVVDSLLIQRCIACLRHSTNLVSTYPEDSGLGGNLRVTLIQTSDYSTSFSHNKFAYFKLLQQWFSLLSTPLITTNQKKGY